MRQAVIGGGLIAIVVICRVTGLVSTADLTELVRRIAPVLGFVAALAIVASLSALAGIFEWVADVAGHVGKGRIVVLWMAIIGVAVACTVFLSIDTTAILLTPVVLELAQRLKLPPLPMALTVVWLANTGSLLLPVSNLTNLLAAGQFGDGKPWHFAAVMWLPALVSIVAPAVILFIVFRREFVGGYSPSPVRYPDDRLLFIVTACVLVALIAALVAGVTVWIAACGAACLLVVLNAVRNPSALRRTRIPWQPLLLTLGLFGIVHVVSILWLHELPTGGTSLPTLLALGGAAAALSNVMNNLPAYLVLEHTGGAEPLRYAAILIGVNVGCLVTPWASLATLIWHAQLRLHDVTISWGRYMLLGCIAAPLTVATAVVAVWMVR